MPHNIYLTSTLILLYRKKKKKNIAELLAKAPKNAKIIKIHFDKRTGVTAQTKITQENEVKWKAGVY